MGGRGGGGGSAGAGVRSEARAWFLRARLQLGTRTQGQERRGRGNSTPAGRAGPAAPSHTRHRPPGAGLSGFLFGEINQPNPTRQKGEEERAGLAGPGGAWAPLPRPEGRARRWRWGREPGRPAVRAHQSAGGRRAGGLGAVCNFAASVAAVPGERAPALAPIGRRRVSWCDLLLSLLAFGHPETNQFDDY